VTQEKLEDTPPHWYVLWTNPNQEDRAAGNLQAWGVETLNPKFRQSCYDERNGKPNRAIKCLFPRYIFARFSANHLLHKVRFTRGVQSVVSFGGSPIPVDEDVVRIIQHRTGQNGLVRVSDEPSPGDMVTIKHGPWRNLVAIFDRETGDSERVSILLTTVGYKARLEIDRSIIEKVPQLNQTWNGQASLK
jgi:transcriptional antiterminator RfaH